MKHALAILLITLSSCIAMAQQFPLAKYSAEWNNSKYLACNTAKNTAYLSEQEKQIIYILNLARMNPQLFCKTVLSKAQAINGTDTTSAYYYKSLVKLMSTMQPLNILLPDSSCYQSALCHATTSGTTGYTGHTRQTAECRRKQRFNGECCMYGARDPLAIIISLLVDDNVESLGHRNICLGGYKKMSPASAEHSQYGSVTVMDFIR